MKNSKSEKIKQFILLKAPTRKEIVKFVACDINGMCSYSFDDEYKGVLRGYYSTFFREAKENGNLYVEDKKHYITDSCLKEGNGMWTKTKDKKIEELQIRNERLLNRLEDERKAYRRISILEAELSRVLALKDSLTKDNKGLFKQFTLKNEEIYDLKSQIRTLTLIGIKGKNEIQLDKDQKEIIIKINIK